MRGKKARLLERSTAPRRRNAGRAAQRGTHGSGQRTNGTTIAPIQRSTSCGDPAPPGPRILPAFGGTLSIRHGCARTTPCMRKGCFPANTALPWTSDRVPARSVSTRAAACWRLGHCPLLCGTPRDHFRHAVQGVLITRPQARAVGAPGNPFLSGFVQNGHAFRCVAAPGSRRAVVSRLVMAISALKRGVRQGVNRPK